MGRVACGESRESRGAGAGGETHQGEATWVGDDVGGLEQDGDDGREAAGEEEEEHAPAGVAPPACAQRAVYVWGLLERGPPARGGAGRVRGRQRECLVGEGRAGDGTHRNAPLEASTMPMRVAAGESGGECQGRRARPGERALAAVAGDVV